MPFLALNRIPGIILVSKQVFNIPLPLLTHPLLIAKQAVLSQIPLLVEAIVET